MIELESSIERTRLIDPSGNAAEQVIEHRTDPLTGSVASINDAHRKVEEELASKVGGLVPGLKL